MNRSEKDKAFGILPGYLTVYIDQAYDELLATYTKAKCNTKLIRASTIEAKCYDIHYKLTNPHL